MEFHLPQQPIRSLRDVVTHLGVITLGILIALGLEQCVAARHRASLAAEAIAGFRRELTDNRAEVQEVVSKMPELRAQIQAQIAQLTALAAPGAGIAPPIKYPGIDFNLVSTASWDTAVATQALNEIPYEKAKGYVEAYGVLRLFLQEEQFGLQNWQQMRAFGTDSAQLTADQRRSLIEQLRRYESFTYTIDLIGKGALKSCDDALR